jgi:hypothetical protein
MQHAGYCHNLTYVFITSARRPMYGLDAVAQYDPLTTPYPISKRDLGAIVTITFAKPLQKFKVPTTSILWRQQLNRGGVEWRLAENGSTRGMLQRTNATTNKCCNEQMLQRTNATSNKCCNERMLQRRNATTNECYNEQMLQRTNAATHECYNERMVQRTNTTTDECYNEQLLPLTNATTNE